MTTTLEREVERRLAECDTRLTRGRLRLIRQLAQSDGPRSAAELHADIGNEVPQSSLYRSLAVLEETGVVTPHYSSRGIARYELAEWLKGHHHHLVCIQCGAVEDLTLSESMEASIQELVDEIGSIAAFRPHNHALEVEGLCRKCA